MFIENRCARCTGCGRIWLSGKELREQPCPCPHNVAVEYVPRPVAAK